MITFLGWLLVLVIAAMILGLCGVSLMSSVHKPMMRSYHRGSTYFLWAMGLLALALLLTLIVNIVRLFS